MTTHLADENMSPGAANALVDSLSGTAKFQTLGVIELE